MLLKYYTISWKQDKKPLSNQFCQYLCGQFKNLIPSIKKPFYKYFYVTSNIENDANKNFNIRIIYLVEL